MYGTVSGAPRSNDKIFLVFTYIWLEDVAKASKVLAALGNNMVSFRRNNLLYHFSLGTIQLHLTSFYATKYFWK